MRPGELLLAAGPAPALVPGRTVVVAIRNTGRLDAYLTSHFPVARASAALEFDRDGLAGARPLAPAGGSVRIPAGAVVEVTLTWD